MMLGIGGEEVWWWMIRMVARHCCMSLYSHISPVYVYYVTC